MIFSISFRPPFHRYRAAAAIGRVPQQKKKKNQQRVKILSTGKPTQSYCMCLL